MKKGLILLTLLLALGMNANAASQKHRHHAQTVQVDSANNQTQDALEAFSDTTAIADDEAVDASIHLDDENVKAAIRHGVTEALADIDGNDVLGMLFVLAILFIIFCGFPLIILIGIIYLIRKNRKDKLKVAQMAMQSGQPIPDQLLENKSAGMADADEYQRGLRQIFVGVGLAIFLGLAAGKWGFGIGALVFCIGLGKVVAAKTAAKKLEKETELNNDLIQNNYD